MLCFCPAFLASFIPTHVAQNGEWPYRSTVRDSRVKAVFSPTLKNSAPRLSRFDNTWRLPTRRWDFAIVTFPMPPEVKVRRSWAQEHHALTHPIYNVDAHQRTRNEILVCPSQTAKKTRESWLKTGFSLSPVPSASCGIRVASRRPCGLDRHLRIHASHWSFHYKSNRLSNLRLPLSCWITNSGGRKRCGCQYNGWPTHRVGLLEQPPPGG